MGEARKLSMGKRRSRSRTGTGFATDYAALLRLTTSARPDLDTFRAVLDRVAAALDRAGEDGHGSTEATAYAAGCARFTALTSAGRQE